jgi:hypothetical protein
MGEEDQWLLLYIIFVFATFISGLALLAARSRYRRDNEYEPWHARLAAAEGKPISKTSTGWVSEERFLSMVALAAIAAVAIFFWRGWPHNIDPQASATLRDIRASQQQTTSGTKTINDSDAAEDQLAARLSALQRENAEFAERLKETQAHMAQDNASVAEQLKAPTHRDNASGAAEKLQGSRENMAGALAQDSGEILRPQTPLPQPNPWPAIPKRRQDVMRNWF